jgi:GNAT superfamily N-acetyltransferase
MHSEPTIRRASFADAEQIARLSAQLGYPCTTEETRRRLATIQGHADHAVLVSEDNGMVIAWIHVLAHPSLVADTPAEVAGLVVDEHYRSHGLGQSLMAAAEQWARDHGCGSVRLRSNVKRSRAHAFYQRLGYELWKSSHAFRKELP